jgi:hypothetical protein
MKYLNFFFSLVSFSSILFSCSGDEPTLNDTPSSLKEGSYEISGFSSRKGQDLMEELYNEMAENSPVLKQLEQGLDKLDENKKEPYEKFDNYTDKSWNYYRSAKNKASSITDSILQKEMIALIEASQKSFKKNIQEYDSLIKNISKNDIILKDHYTAMKIVLTLPVIEKYQVENIPKNEDAFRKIIQNQKYIISKIDSLNSK